MAFKEMTFTHRRIARTGDGAGGYIETPDTRGTVVGRKHFYQKESQRQLEGTQQPARAVDNLCVVIFDNPEQDIAKTDLLLEGVVADADAATATTWTVKHVRHYDYQTQADVELVE
jgi:hypothetical protein